jgi:hypothetical protein
MKIIHTYSLRGLRQELEKNLVISMRAHARENIASWLRQDRHLEQNMPSTGAEFRRPSGDSQKACLGKRLSRKFPPISRELPVYFYQVQLQHMRTHVMSTTFIETFVRVYAVLPWATVKTNGANVVQGTNGKTSKCNNQS